MKHLHACMLGLGLAAMPLSGVPAHSPEQLEQDLREREKYFQPIDRPAPGFSLEDADGTPVALEDLRGKVVVLHFIYASCPDVCPLHAERIAKVQSMVNRTPMRDQVQFVSITTDPRKDTPDVLRGYGADHGLGPANWVFLTAGRGRPEDTTRKLVEAFGHQFTVTPDGAQVHGVVTHVIDQQGRWRANFHGLKFGSTNLVVFVNALVNENPNSHDHGEQGFGDRRGAHNSPSEAPR